MDPERATPDDRDSLLPARWRHLATRRTLLRAAGWTLPWVVPFGIMGATKNGVTGALGGASLALLVFTPPTVVELALEPDPTLGYGSRVLGVMLAAWVSITAGLFNLVYLGALWQGGGVAAATSKLSILLSRPDAWVTLGCLCLMIGGILGLAAGLRAPVPGRTRALGTAVLSAAVGVPSALGLSATSRPGDGPLELSVTLTFGLALWGGLVLAVHAGVDHAVERLLGPEEDAEPTPREPAP